MGGGQGGGRGRGWGEANKNHSNYSPQHASTSANRQATAQTKQALTPHVNRIMHKIKNYFVLLILLTSNFNITKEDARAAEIIKKHNKKHTHTKKKQAKNHIPGYTNKTQQAKDTKNTNIKLHTNIKHKT